MKFTKILAMAMLAATGTAFAQSGKTVEYPFIEMANTYSVDVAKVELADTATVLHIDAYYRPHYWISIASKGYLLADGKRYALKRTDGIEADAKFFMPDSGEASFRLIFEPLPEQTKSFDYIEADDCPTCFKLYGISLDPGKAATLAYDVPEGVPAEWRETDLNAPVPAPVFKMGETTVNIHLLGYREELGNEINLYVNEMFGNQEPYSAQVDRANGTATIRFMQYGPAQALLSFGQASGHIWLVPNEETEVYLDLRSSGWFLLKRREMKGKASGPGVFQELYVSGAYHHLNGAMARRDSNVLRYSMNLYSGEFADYKMTADQYARLVADKYAAYADSIAQSAAAPVLKEICLLNLKQEALEGIVRGDYFREHNYRHIHNNWNRAEKVEGIDPIRPEHVASVCRLFDVNDPKLLMGVHTSGYASFVYNPLFQGKQGLSYNLSQVAGFSTKATNAALTEEDFGKLKALDNPFFLQVFEKKQEIVKAKLAELADKAVIEPTPDVPNEKLLEAIFAPYKGKVIMVDFWNTWCGPCRASIKANEPLKSGELKSDRIVWLYIANETSPMVKYKTMIPGIQGKHYRLNDKQWAYVCDQLKIDGIPSYVLVDQSGQFKLRNDFRNHEVMKKELKKMIQE